MSTTERPNILFFFTDQQRWDTCGCYGSPLGLTPNLDRLARRGVRFERAFTCQPLCAPARGTLMTGRYATAHGTYRNHLPLRQDQPMLARCLAEAGYETGYIGKLHLSSVRTDPVPCAERCGFDGFWEAADTLEYTSRPYEGRVFDADGRPVEFRGQYRADFLTDRTIGFLERRRDDRPFFLFLSYIEPHQQNDMGRFIAPEGYAERYANPWVPPDLRDRPGDWVSSLPDYYGCVARLDECLGRLLAWLDAHGQAERTIVVFTSDHGCHFRTRNREYKRCAHESAIRIPLVVAGPGFDTGRVAPEMASLVDVPPTLLDAARIAPPATFQGRSLASLAQGPVADWPEEVLVQISAAELGRAIRTGRWKYSVFAPDRDPNGDASSLVYVERYLYDLAADPHETVNLAGRPGAYREAADELMHALKRRMREAGEQEPEIVPARYYA